MMKYFISIFFFIAFSCTENRNNSIPNIVIIFMDDLGYGDISNFGAINYKTPNIDKMVNDGMDILDIGGYSSKPGAKT